MEGNPNNHGVSRFRWLGEEVRVEIKSLLPPPVWKKLNNALLPKRRDLVSGGGMLESCNLAGEKVHQLFTGAGNCETNTIISQRTQIEK